MHNAIRILGQATRIKTNYLKKVTALRLGYKGNIATQLDPYNTYLQSSHAQSIKK